MGEKIPNFDVRNHILLNQLISFHFYSLRGGGILKCRTRLKIENLVASSMQSIDMLFLYFGTNDIRGDKDNLDSIIEKYKVQL